MYGGLWEIEAFPSVTSTRIIKQQNLGLVASAEPETKADTCQSLETGMPLMVSKALCSHRLQGANNVSGFCCR